MSAVYTWNLLYRVGSRYHQIITNLKQPYHAFLDILIDDCTTEPVLCHQGVLSHVVLSHVSQDEGRHLSGLVDLGVFPAGPAGLDGLVVKVPAENLAQKWWLILCWSLEYNLIETFIIFYAYKVCL